MSYIIHRDPPRVQLAKILFQLRTKIGSEYYLTISNFWIWLNPVGTAATRCIQTLCEWDRDLSLHYCSSLALRPGNLISVIIPMKSCHIFFSGEKKWTMMISLNYCPQPFQSYWYLHMYYIWICRIKINKSQSALYGNSKSFHKNRKLCGTGQLN